MYISAVPLEKTGFNMHIASMPLPDLTWAYIAKIPAVAGIVIAGGALSWVITRRNNQGKGE
jgi:hypothetical protein